jgi:Cd2+/Zn2+-exporting ATPase
LALIETGLKPLSGIASISPDYLRRRLRVEFDPRHTDETAIARRIREVGFPVEIPAQVATAAAPPPARVRKTTIVSGALLLAAAAGRLITGETGPVVAILAIAATAIAGWPVAQAGLRSLRLKSLDMNALMVIAASGAVATGDYFEAATAMFLFGIAVWLESFSLGRARNAVRSLLELTPTVAHRRDGDHAGDVDPASLVPGDRVLVKPGERVPIDGVVITGVSSVNQAPITGESVPVEKGVGDTVFAGTLNAEGSLEVRVIRSATESTLAHIARLVELAQSSRSPTQRFVDQFARYYTPAVIAIAVLIAIVPPLAWSYAWLDWLHRGLVLLVIACPCALVISTPVTIVCGLHAAARRGMLIKGGEHLEQAGQINCIAFDKTGTLTTGQMQVINVISLDGTTNDDVLRIAAALEAHSEHPIAQAITTAYQQHSTLHPPLSTRFSSLRGFGVQADLDGQTYYIGSPRFFQDDKLRGAAGQEQVASLAKAATSQATVAIVGTRDQLLGAILLADRPRDDATPAVRELRDLGVAPIVMITGDNAQIAKAVAAEVGITDVRAELLPDDKVKQVAVLADDYPHLAAVGDGVNDAPVLASARLGVALGSQASDTALETADVVIMSPQVGRVVELLRLGRRCRQLLWQNIGLSLGIKVAVLLLAAAGLATMWMAVAADVGASMLVIFNGMRILRIGQR